MKHKLRCKACAGNTAYPSDWVACVDCHEALESDLIRLFKGYKGAKNSLLELASRWATR